MPGTTLRIDVDDRGFQAGVKEAQRSLSRLPTRGLMENVGAEVLARAMERFRHAQSPDGRAWPKTVRQALGDPRQPLLGQGSQLAQSYSFQASAREVEVGSNLRYAAIQHFGGTVRARRAKALRFRIGKTWVTKKSVFIPPRPALGVNTEDEAGIAETAEEWLRLALRKFSVRK